MLMIHPLMAKVQEEATYKWFLRPFNGSSISQSFSFSRLFIFKACVWVNVRMCLTSWSCNKKLFENELLQSRNFCGPRRVCKKEESEKERPISFYTFILFRHSNFTVVLLRFERMMIKSFIQCNPINASNLLSWIEAILKAFPKMRPPRKKNNKIHPECRPIWAREHER